MILRALIGTMAPMTTCPGIWQIIQKVGGTIMRQGLLMAALIQMNGFSTVKIEAAPTGESGGLLRTQAFLSQCVVALPLQTDPLVFLCKTEKAFCSSLRVQRTGLLHEG